MLVLIFTGNASLLVLHSVSGFLCAEDEFNICTVSSSWNEFVN